MAEAVTKDGIHAVCICSIPGCAHENIITIGYYEAVLLARCVAPRPPRWHYVSGWEFRPTDLRCAKCNQPLSPIFTKSELEIDLTTAERQGFISVESSSREAS